MDGTAISIASQYPAAAWRLRLLLAATFAALLVGIVAPIVSLTKFMVVENTFSVLSGVLALLQDGQFFLFLVIAAFSIVLPLLKIALLAKLLCVRKGSAASLDRCLHWMHLYGKWSMLDVFIVAVLVVAVKLGALVSVEMRYGLYAFAAAVLLTMYVTARVVSLSERLKQAAQQA